MREEDKEFLFGAVLCPSCEFGIITKGHSSVCGFSCSNQLDAAIHMICPYCGEELLVHGEGRQIYYNIDVKSHDCRNKEITIVDA